MAFPSAADWAAPSKQPGALPRCAFPGAAAGAAPTPLRTLCVIGERHSGTNFVSALLDLNFAFEDDADDDAANATSADALRVALHTHPRLKDGLGRVPPRPGRVGHGCAHTLLVLAPWLTQRRGSCTAHKHASQPARGAAAHVAPGFAPPDEAAFLAVLVVRNAVDWCVRHGACVAPEGRLPLTHAPRRARGMHAAPWETALPDTKAQSVAAFLSQPWHRGMDLHSGDAAHAHALAMRSAKHAAWRRLPWRHAETVQYECLVAGAGAGQPGALDWLSSLEARYALRRSKAAAHGWVLPPTRVGGRAAFEADTLMDAGDAAGAARVPQQAADYAEMERGTFAARAEQALAAGAVPSALAELAQAVLDRADAAAEAALGYEHTMHLAAQLAAAAPPGASAAAADASRTEL